MHIYINYYIMQFSIRKNTHFFTRKIIEFIYISIVRGEDLTLDFYVGDTIRYQLVKL